MRKLACLAGAIAVAAGVGACGGSSTVSGTETLTGVVGGAAAAKSLNNNVPPRFPSLVFAGPVKTSMTNVSLGNNKSLTTNRTFVTPAGNFTVTRTVKSRGQQQPSVTGKSGSTCYFRLNGGSGSYAVDGSHSTGKFAGATGSGTYSITLVATANLLPGKTTCSGNNAGNVTAKGTAVTFKASGPLTVKH
jgi:hypothetical protein